MAVVLIVLLPPQRYRYPRGESYLDVIARLEPVIFEIERQKQDVVIVSHQAVLRCLYAYLQDLPLEECPYINVPLHTVYVFIIGSPFRATSLIVFPRAALS